MKRIWGSFLLMGVLLTGCANLERLDSIQSSAEKLLTDRPHSQDSPVMSTADPEGGLLAKDEAEKIALAHAGFTRDQVSGLRTRYQWDDGIHQYEVEFRQGLWEYSYEIHAVTGQILEAEQEDGTE